MRLEHRATRGDLVVEDDRPPAVDVTHDGVDDDAVVRDALLGAGGDGQAQQPGELRRDLRVAEVRADHDAVGEVGVAVVVGEHADRGEVVDRRREESVHLGRVQGHRQHPVRTGGGDHVSDKATTERDA